VTLWLKLLPPPPPPPPPPLLCSGFDPESGVVKVRLAGSCVGCPSSAATLRNGVEAMLMYYIPEVRSVREVKTEIDAVSDEVLNTLESRLAAAGTPIA
jgi:Fe-S cluster biogenesis protein NfuA